MSNQNSDLQAFITRLLQPSTLPLTFDNYAVMNSPSTMNLPTLSLDNNSHFPAPNIAATPQLNYSTNSLQSTLSTLSSLPQPLPDLEKLIEVIVAALQRSNGPPPILNSQYISKDRFGRLYPLHAALLWKVDLLSISRACYDPELVWIKDSSPQGVLDKMARIIYEALQIVSNLEVHRGRTDHLLESSMKLFPFLLNTTDNFF